MATDVFELLTREARGQPRAAGPRAARDWTGRDESGLGVFPPGGGGAL